MVTVIVMAVVDKPLERHEKSFVHDSSILAFAKDFFAAAARIGDVNAIERLHFVLSNCVVLVANLELYEHMCGHVEAGNDFPVTF